MKKIKWIEKNRETIVLKADGKTVKTFALGLLWSDGWDYFDKATWTFTELIDCGALDIAYEEIYGVAIDYRDGGQWWLDEYSNECYWKQHHTVTVVNK